MDRRAHTRQEVKVCIGADMSDTLKETARGGLATTRTALEVKNRLKM